MRSIRPSSIPPALTPRVAVVSETSHLPSPHAGSVPPLRPRIEIPVRDPSPEAHDRARHTARGRFLARQDAWDDLAEEMHVADRSGQLTTGLNSVAMYLAEGARADVIEAACAACARGEPRSAQTILAAFESALSDEEEHHQPALAYVIAMAHVDMAQAWRGASPTAKLSQQRRTAFLGHMQAAVAIADRFDPFETGSILWAMLRCAVLETDVNPAARLADDYEDLIELDPRVPAHLKALGRDARPRRFGTWEVLDNEARRVAMQTADVWGVAGYAWVYMGALECDTGAFRRLDAELFCEGLHDILDRFPTQDMANRLAAFTGLTVGGPSDPGSARRRVADSLGWITQDHLRELHPAIWAEASTPGRTVPTGSGDDILKRGRIRANSSLAEFYAPALDAGRRLIFTEDGMRLSRD